MDVKGAAGAVPKCSGWSRAKMQRPQPSKARLEPCQNAAAGGVVKGAAGAVPGGGGGEGRVAVPKGTPKGERGGGSKFNVPPLIRDSDSRCDDDVWMCQSFLKNIKQISGEGLKNNFRITQPRQKKLCRSVIAHLNVNEMESNLIMVNVCVCSCVYK